MVATPSSMVSIGTPANDFQLSEPGGKTFSLSDAKNKPVLLIFMCNHCPYVIHIIEKLAELGRYAERKGVVCFGINANDVENYPQDSPEKMISFAKQYSLSFPYLFDETQEVAKSYKAACTPDFFLYDKNHHLFYRGQMDSSRPGNNKPVTGESLKAAIDDLCALKTPPDNQKPSIGCNIKWKS